MHIWTNGFCVVFFVWFFNNFNIQTYIDRLPLYSQRANIVNALARKVEKVNIHMNVSNFLNSITRKSNKHVLYWQITNGYPNFSEFTVRPKPMERERERTKKKKKHQCMMIHVPLCYVTHATTFHLT